jgi:hypothetical protein
MNDPRSTAQQSSENSIEPLEADIRHRAYSLWEADGKPDGRDEEYWHRARELLQDEGQSSYPPSQSRGHRT